MSISTLDYQPRKHLSVSTLVSFARCPRRYFYQKCGLQSMGVPIRPNYGNSMHKAVPVLLVSDDLDLSMRAFIADWTKTEELMADYNLYDDPMHSRASAKRSLTHLQHTRKFRKPYELVAPPQTPGIEFSDPMSDYEVPWILDINLPVPLVGRFDGICETPSGTAVWELKTATRIGSDFFGAHEMAVQNNTYAAVAKTQLDMDIVGVQVEGIQKHKTKVDNQTQLVPIPDHHLDDTLQWLHYIGNQLLEMEKEFLHHVENGAEQPWIAFPKNFAGCTPYAWFYMPTWRCEYADLCRAVDPSQMVGLYEHKDDADFIKLTVGGE